MPRTAIETSTRATIASDAAVTSLQRVAIFGNAGGGKSTLARQLAAVTGLPLHVVDKIQFTAGGGAVPHQEYLRAHARLIEAREWIIDGFGDVPSAWARFEAADTLIHIDLPLATHFFWVTKRLIQGGFATPPGWPAGSPVVSSTLNSYRVLWRCHAHLTPRYRAYVAQVRDRKRVHHLRSAREIRRFLEAVQHEVRSAR